MKYATIFIDEKRKEKIKSFAIRVSIKYPKISKNLGSLRYRKILT